MEPPLVSRVHEFWNNAACGEALALSHSSREGYRQHSDWRYAHEPFIAEFARFEQSRGQRVLEIGVGLGADHQRFAEAGADLDGLDLTGRAIEHTRRRLELNGLSSRLVVGNAECLPYRDSTFDLVYSWGVLHHTPDTAQALREVHRVLRPGGTARIMLYHRPSWVLWMLWTRYALLRFRPWQSLRRIAAERLESPGTQAFTHSELQRLFRPFLTLDIRYQLSSGDLLLPHAGQRHRGLWLTVARCLWPRRMIQTWGRNLGLFALITATKASITPNP